MTSVPEDEVVATVNFYFRPTEIAPESVREVALSSHVADDGRQAFTMGRIKVESGDHERRQREFEAQLQSVLDTVRAATVGFAPATDSGRLLVSIGLVPEEGHAGILIPVDTLADWVSVGAEIEIEAWPGAMWSSTTPSSD